jgi:hypothetical protein
VKIRVVTSRLALTTLKTAHIVERADYAASLNASTSSNQGCRRFHLGKIWATNLRSPAILWELRLASQPPGEGCPP